MASGEVVVEFDSEVIDLDRLAERLQSESRLTRQKAAGVYVKLARHDAQSILPFADVMIRALENEEARTRGSVLDALLVLVDLDPALGAKVSDYAEEALFDEDNGSLRLMGMRFLCKVGAKTPQASLKVWPFIDEALQCFHGDAEFNDMLHAVAGFAAGNIDETVKEGLRDRLSFDALNSKGSLRKRAQAVLDALS